jgi:hypothetical protein
MINSPVTWTIAALADLVQLAVLCPVYAMTLSSGELLLVPLLTFCAIVLSMRCVATFAASAAMLFSTTPHTRCRRRPHLGGDLLCVYTLTSTLMLVVHAPYWRVASENHYTNDARRVLFGAACVSFFSSSVLMFGRRDRVVDA